ncbi:cysteine desulfurase [Candidatus Woesearchaeota archaeon]|mgnify:FL=1|jgi:cysteine desulfurase|nr:cysteine desulfurase [Candidatus Woesearchaeota archaeon]MBT4336737.1 cysteine desulfurase [Candidatus Woesearchaeota archaeon]MBT4469405.1 cysteine desulfurase [Candidatus Woesearchaeota archaeon]MBT6744200.1 cysteine desulfurase [Candidatus Woesearchaeota archaeon]
MKTIYLDHAATTPLDPRVKKEMDSIKTYANPSALHQMGLEAKEILNNARNKVAKILNAEPEEIIFTSGGTESINLAIKGIGKGHIITSKVEHPAVLETCKFLERNGCNVSYLDVDKDGLISLKDLEKAIKKETILITIMYANNEIGTIQPVKEISKIAKKHKVPFHTDACQAGFLNLNINADLITLNGSKIYGPKGIGILYKRKNIKLEPLMHGGGQEFNLRSGTENLTNIVGFAKALELAQKEDNNKITKLRDYFIQKVQKEIPRTFINGHKTKRLQNNANISFLDVEGESILLYLDHKGILVSTGSACSSKKLEISHVLDAIGIKHDAAHGSIRFSLGKSTTKIELDYVVKELKGIIHSLRMLSPIHLNKGDIRK